MLVVTLKWYSLYSCQTFYVGMTMSFELAVVAAIVMVVIIIIDILVVYSFGVGIIFVFTVMLSAVLVLFWCILLAT